jgi:elongation factor Ts
MEITAQLVKKLREETDAPMMECKRALQQAAEEQGNGAAEDAIMERAKTILREAGKAQATKRADREASNGVIALAKEPGAVAAVVLLSETDFVARNDEFVSEAHRLAEHFLKNEPGEDPLSAVVDGSSVKERIEALVAKIRENIQLGAVKRVASEQTIGAYLHHDKAKAAIVVVEGGDADLASKVATQVVAYPTIEVIAADQIDAERLANEVEMEKRRAIEEGAPEDRAEMIAKGRVNKEFVSQVALLETPWFLDPKMKVKDAIGGMKVVRMIRLQVGREPIDVLL